MPVTWSGEVEIEAPSAAVWRVILDPARDADWRGPLVAGVVALTAGEPAPGSRYETRYGAADRAPTITELTEVDPPRRLAWRQVEPDHGLVTIDGRYELASLPDDRTRFRVQTIAEAGGIASRLTAPFIAWYLRRRIVPEQLRQLAALVASEAAGAG